MPDELTRRAPLLTDVARVAGVSVPTVSRVLSGASPVSDERRRRVLAAIAELDYTPNAAARSLALGTRNVLGVIVGDTTHYGYAATIEGIEESAAALGLGVLISVIKGDSEASGREAVSAVLAQAVAGVIVLQFDRPGIAAARSLPGHVPAVSVGGFGSMRPRADIDDFDGALRITRHLLDLGHESVHYIAIPVTGETAPRLLGWRAALEARNVVRQEFSQATWGPESAYAIGLGLADDPTVTAVLAGNDDLAVGVIKALTDKGRDVPGDVSVAGFDDLPLSRFLRPPLTSVRQDFRDLGRRAVALMQGVLAGTELDAVSTVAPELIIRESTARPRLR